MNEGAGERQLIGERAALDGGEHADGADAVLVDRVDVIVVVLGLRHDATEIRQEATHHARLVHHSQDPFRIAPVGEDRAEGAVGLGIVAYLCGDQTVTLVDQSRSGRMDVAAFGLGATEDCYEAHRSLTERTLIDRRDTPARNKQPVAGRPYHCPGLADRRCAEPFGLQDRAEDPRELAHLLRHKEIVFHEPLDGQVAAARPVPHARRDFGLAVEG